MNAKRVLGITLTVIVLLLPAAGIRMAQSPDAAAEAPRIPPAQPAAQPAAAANSVAQTEVRSAQTTGPVASAVTGPVIIQTLTLLAGWNAIYLEVEPINGAPLGSDGVPEQSVMEWVFGGLGGNLDSVWTYSQPVSSRDYLIDPGDGLWDEPGWLRYIPDENMGPDGVSREFLTTLHTLHANTGYLVKMNVGDTIKVTGKPVPGHHRWTAGAYNLAGFPLAAGGSTVAAFTAGSPITEVRGLTEAGGWTLPLAGDVPLLPGVAYLVRYADEPLDPDYTAPLDVGTSAEAMTLPTEGLKFHAGLYGNSMKLRLQNLSPAAIEVTLALPEGAESPVALHYVSSADPPVDPVDLRAGPVTLGLEAAPGSRWIELQVPTAKQPAAGEALLEISCAALGTRWLIPLSAEPASYEGLWVGDAVVDNVNEARLGATDDAHDLTIALASLNNSGVRGSAAMHELIAGASTTLQITVTLALPADTIEMVTPPAVTAPYVHGWVFVDANQNGQRDAGEKGLAAVQVSLALQGGGYSASGATLPDGSYWLSALQTGTYNLTIETPGGYTSDFAVTLPAADVDGAPVTATNAAPASVTLNAVGATAVTPASYLAQVLPDPATLPYYDANDNRVEPPLNFGFVRADRAVLRAGLCDAPREDLAELGTVRNGQLLTNYTGALAGLIGDANIYIERLGAGVACGNIEVGAPTRFDDGRGSEARFRVLLRVSTAGQTELLPYYVVDENQRISAVNFLSLQEPKIIAGPFGAIGSALVFDLALPADDPLNPFKHKYNPDHDNLDRAFQQYADEVPTHLYESYNVGRKVTLTLTALPPGGDETSAAALDWGGAVWGGDYREVVEGLHKNTITARGYFVIRRVLSFDQLVDQDYDK